MSKDGDSGVLAQIFSTRNFMKRTRFVFWNLHETRLIRRIPGEKNVISSQEKQVVNSRDVFIKKDPRDAPQKSESVKEGDINHASKNIKRRQLKGKEEKRGKQREGVSNTYYTCKYLASLSVTEKQYGNLTNAPSKEELQNLRKQDSDEVFAGHKSPYIKLF